MGDADANGAEVVAEEDVAEAAADAEAAVEDAKEDMVTDVPEVFRFKGPEGGGAVSCPFDPCFTSAGFGNGGAGAPPEEEGGFGGGGLF